MDTQKEIRDLTTQQRQHDDLQEQKLLDRAVEQVHDRSATEGLTEEMREDVVRQRQKQEATQQKASQRVTEELLQGEAPQGK